MDSSALPVNADLDGPHRPGVDHALPPAGARREGTSTGRGVVGLEH
jgi:hypothetical protein